MRRLGNRQSGAQALLFRWGFRAPRPSVTR